MPDPPLAQDSRGSRQTVQLCETVGDHQHRGSGFRNPSNALKEHVRLIFGQRSGHLIQDEQFDA